MLSLRGSFVLLAAASLYIAVPACSVGSDETATESAAIETLDPTSVVGTIASGATSAAVAHPGTPRFRALSFQAQAGETIQAWVRSDNGDAVAYVTNATFKTIGSNDDESATSHNAHVTTTAIESGTHYVVFRERDLEPATFRVTLLVNGSTPVPGGVCSTPDQIVSQACGTCGKRSSLCEARPGGGPPLWTGWSPCAGEIAGGCQPGTVQTGAECGRCGTRTLTCTSTCAWNTGACVEPPNACTPGLIQVTTAGCTADTYREQTCTDACGWGGWSPTCSVPTANITAGAQGDVDTTFVVLSASQTAPVVEGACPNATLGTSRTTPYGYVRVNNTNTRAARVSIWTSSATSTSRVSTILAAYAGSAVPATDAARKACLAGVATTGGQALGGDFRDAALTGSRAVVIQPNASVLVYVGSSTTYNPARPETSTGPVAVSVRVDAL